MNNNLTPVSMLADIAIVDRFARLFASIPHAITIFYGLAAGTWLIGVNVLVAMHHRRLGKPWWAGLRPFASPFGNFNLLEWIIFLLLLVATIFFAYTATEIRHLR